MEIFLRVVEEEEDEEMRQENGGGDNDDGDDDDDDDNDIDMDSVRILIERELTSTRLYDQELAILASNNWYQVFRTHGIDYILSTGREFRFSRRTVYRAVIYQDNFFASEIIDNGDYWGVRLLSVACLSLSREMDENRVNVPQLSEYPTGIFNINANAIRRVHALVLNEFNGNLNCVTTFDFRNFFIYRFCRDVSRTYITRKRTDAIITSVLRADVSLMNHRASVIAAAATLLALNREFTREEVEIEINALPINRYLQFDNVYYCYCKLLVLN